MSDTVSDHSADHQHSALQTYYSEYLINVKHTTRSTVGHYRGALDRISEMLREKKTCKQIIESASRPIKDLDNRLTLEAVKSFRQIQQLQRNIRAFIPVMKQRQPLQRIFLNMT